MSSDDKFDEAVTLIDRQIAAALRTTRKFRDIWGNGKLAYRRRLGGFATLMQPSQEEVEYAFFKSSLEFSVRSNIVNPALDSLFNLYGVNVGWPEGSIIAWSNNIAHERANPIEFAISENGETVGYRYTIPDMLTSDDIADILEIWEIDRIVVIDWSGEDTETLQQSDSELCIGGSNRITRVSSADFFEEFFTGDLYSEFVNRIREAVYKAEDIIGFQAISRLSMPRLSPFRAEIIEDVSQVIEGLPDNLAITGSDGTEYHLSIEDREILDEAFFIEGLGRSLSGTRGFARCFTTSEYLQRAFRQGGEFDHTAVVCGYLKAVEQLANDLMLATLGTIGSDGLFIATYKRGRNYPLRRPFDWGKDTPHVQFIPRNKRLFSTTLPPLANLLHDNENAWRISDEGRHFVLLKLRAFADKDRNGYFHKDNFTSPDEVKKIREDAIALLYFLVGGYAIPGSQERQREILGMKYVPYNDMYMKLSSIPIHDFVVDFDGQDAVKAIRLYEQPAVEYDEYGLVSSKVFFVKVDDHRGHHEWESIETVDKADVFEVSRENMPSRMYYVKRDGTQVQFWQND
ncbi:hypothetical protein GMI69_01000 [Eggerthellaceae bacterium zg-887]|uniref:hypothetical protein n=1 Tax=Xiamenia xianingshaonis TaxID=2682776 RepID=UPI00140B9E4B|nr:hypothetical protein [Xiamenia xianingshaonis]NHM15254.1 hypothetical protein [Xiamenia xianingshaonis]